MRLLATILLGVTLAAPSYALTLSGRVTRTSGDGVYPIDIDVFNSSTKTLIPTPGDTTDALGFYSIAVPSGVYDVVFVPEAGSHLFTKTFRSMSLAANTTLNATLARGHYLTGRVIGPSGAGVALADLDFHSPATGATPVNEQGTVADSTGFFTALVDSALWDVSVVAPFSARLVSRLYPAVGLTADVALGNVSLDPGGLVQGTVTDQGFFPIADGDIDVRLAGKRSKLFTPQDNTAPDGTWALVLPAGDYDISANPPPGLPYASATARSILVGAADVTVPNLMLPPGIEFRGRCRDPLGNGIPNVDLDVDSLPTMLRLETPGDATDAGGDFRVLTSAWSFRVTLSPPVEARLLPVRLDSLHIAGPLDLGNIPFVAGHWVSGTVVEAGTGTPVEGANLDLVRLSNGKVAITPGDVTDAAGFFRVSTDGSLYTLRVLPPSAEHDTLTLSPFGSLNDTTVTLSLTRRPGADAPAIAPGPLLLSPPWPNPTRDQASVTFAAPAGELDLAVWDLAGRRVATLYRGAAGPPRHVRWDARDRDGRPLPAGVYYLRLADGRHAAIRRLVLLR